MTNELDISRDTFRRMTPKSKMDTVYDMLIRIDERMSAIETRITCSEKAAGERWKTVLKFAAIAVSGGGGGVGITKLLEWLK